MSKDKFGKPFITQVEDANLAVTPAVDAPPAADIIISADPKEDASSAPKAEPLGSKRLAAEQEAGRASLARKHGPGQLEKEQTTGKKAANKS